MKIHLSRSLRTLGLALIVSISSLASTNTASAQVQAADPYHITITTPATKLWSGDGEMWYAIDTLDEGTVLLVDGTSEGWLRVAYPKGTPALVRAEEAEVINNGAAVRLTRPSSLRAYDMNNPTFEGCYKGVYYDMLPPGTQFKVISELRGPNNQLDGFFIEAPASARGYIMNNTARDATQTEIDAYNRAIAAATPKPAEQTPPTTNPETTVAQNDTTQTNDDTTTDDDTTTAPPTIATPLREPDEPQPAPDLDEFDQAVADFERLDEAYVNVMAQPAIEAELDELITEYKTLTATLPKGDATYDAIADHAQRRILALELQQRVRAARQELAKLRALADAEREATESLTQSVRNANTDYAFVGRLLPSAVYTGDNLPLLYRLVSVSGVTGRTLGYIIPDQALNLDAKVGSIVGVVGQRATTSSRIGVIDVSRIEPLAPGQ
jgi:hypothetical protein